MFSECAAHFLGFWPAVARDEEHICSTHTACWRAFSSRGIALKRTGVWVHESVGVMCDQRRGGGVSLPLEFSFPDAVRFTSHQTRNLAHRSFLPNTTKQWSREGIPVCMLISLGCCIRCRPWALESGWLCTCCAGVILVSIGTSAVRGGGKLQKQHEAQSSSVPRCVRCRASDLHR